MILPISLTIAAAAALVHIWLAARVSQLRRRHHISVGDKGNETVLTRMRAHGNFSENVPIFLVLLALIELGIGSELWLWVAGLLFILARLLHAFGMDRPAPNLPRMLGMGLTALILLGLAGYAIYLSYSERPQPRRFDAPVTRAEAPRT
ncbi:MAG TPA: MAPEG family protein [Allosphingosinicella sp.]|jgi:hypothetical protein